MPYHLTTMKDGITAKENPVSKLYYSLSSTSILVSDRTIIHQYTLALSPLSAVNEFSKKNEAKMSQTANTITIERLDHLVLTVKNIEATCDFYSRTLGMDVITFKGNRKALKFGNTKVCLTLVEFSHNRRSTTNSDQPAPSR